VTRSVFTGIVMGLAGQEDRAAALTLARLHLPDTDHCPYAVRFTAAEEHCSDAGEPSGTAGRPLLEVLRQADVEGAILLVGRHFGGVKLGRPRLLRAYRLAGETALHAARLEEPEDRVGVRLTLTYGAYAALVREWPGLVAGSATVSFRDTVVVDAVIPSTDGPRLTAYVRSRTGILTFERGEAEADAPSGRSRLQWPDDAD
jgi:putative IMPACT (imprinted ancient) family translation regulator